jgi:DNA-binding MarR family transcriptional regulator
MSLQVRKNKRSINSKTLDALVGYHLKRATGVILSRFPFSSSKHLLKPSEFAVLSLIAENEDLRAADICEYLNFKQPNLVKLLNRFLKEEWIVRYPDPTDKRAINLSLSFKGKNLVKALKLGALNSEKLVLKKLTYEEKQLLTNLLKKLY